MELLFNELSIRPLCANKYQANDRMIQFAETVNESSKKGFKNIRSHLYSNSIELTNNYSLHSWLNDKEASKNHKDYLFGKFVHPFIREGDKEIEEQYIENYYYFEDEENGITETECVGLASAYLYDTLSISLPASPVWNKTKLLIIIKKDEQIENATVFNVYSKNSFAIQDIFNFIENLGTYTLEETTLKPEEKKANYGKHHGQAEIKEMCDKLKMNPYVKEMLAIEWGGGKFIRKIKNDGSIEICLIKTQRKYAILVKTTGRNYREAKAIAEILEEEYS